ncbi:HNH endonuclease signature motif containing protein [Rhizobium sp. LjRoot30]|uniref:HNH endonuclease n=1 Tax=Rhizobium sp. LjRoot30 TaxID=3342320 RepID=UPI003ED06CA1
MTEEKILDKLARSVDPLDRELARVLKSYQNIRASRNLTRSIGYEPRDLGRLGGAVALIESRVKSRASGFDEVPANDSYEAIILKFPDRFASDTVTIARQRIGIEEDMFAPTADPEQLDVKVHQLLSRTNMPFPHGVRKPALVQTIGIQFLRDPRVKAWVLKRAGGRCEACKLPAPFKTLLGLHFLEVHHVKSLADGGSDTVSNAVAVCPNCHRALHYASDREVRTAQLFKNVGAQLVPE